MVRIEILLGKSRLSTFDLSEDQANKDEITQRLVRALQDKDDVAPDQIVKAAAPVEAEHLNMRYITGGLGTWTIEGASPAASLTLGQIRDMLVGGELADGSVFRWSISRKSYNVDGVRKVLDRHDRLTNPKADRGKPSSESMDLAAPATDNRAIVGTQEDDAKSQPDDREDPPTPPPDCEALPLPDAEPIPPPVATPREPPPYGEGKTEQTSGGSETSINGPPHADRQMPTNPLKNEPAVPSSPPSLESRIRAIIVALFAIGLLGTTGYLAWMDYTSRRCLETELANASRQSSEIRGDLESGFDSLSAGINELAQKSETFGDEAQKGTQQALSLQTTKIDALSKKVDARNDSVDESLKKVREHFDGDTGLNAKLDALVKVHLQSINQRLDATTTSITALEKQMASPAGSPQEVAAALAGSEQFQRLVLPLDQRLQTLEGSLERVLRTVRIPDVKQLTPVLLVIDGGELLEKHNPAVVQKAVIDAVGDALRLSSGREIGLTWNRGDRQTQIIMFEAHYWTEWPSLVERLREDMIAAPGAEADQLAGMSYAVNRCAPRDKAERKRVVYITYENSFAAPADADAWDRLTRDAQEYNVETWVVQLLNPNEKPSQPLAQLATSTGGLFFAVSGGQADATKQLTETLIRALGLPAPPQ